MAASGTITALSALRIGRLSEQMMATGWAQDGAVQEQIDATVKDGISRAQSRLPQGPSASHCADCGSAIPEARRNAIPGVRLCIACQEAEDREASSFSGYNRRGSKDSQLR
jgi:phage/conjugal plasmid C-4 type zinc finger TraR family protein